MDRVNNIQIQQYHSPAGELILGSYDGELCLCNWTDAERRERIEQRIQKAFRAGFEESSSEILDKASTELDEYFARKRFVFDIPLALIGTEFQKKVWQELSKIPYGVTVSYAVLATNLNSPKAVRAVANANAANAISIFIPCHRVIGSNGLLTGYGGGLDAKRILLELEKLK